MGMETDHGYEVEYGNYDLGAEDAGKFEDPVERDVQEIKNYLVWQHQQGEQQAAEEAKSENEQGWDRIYESMPILQDDNAATRQVAETIDQLARDHARDEEGLSGAALEQRVAELRDNSEFVRDVIDENFAGRMDRFGNVTPGDGGEMFIRMSQEAQSRRLSWDHPDTGQD
jgi:hypothetical protein